MPRTPILSLTMLACALIAHPASAAAPTTVYAGLEVGNTDSNRIDAGVSVRYFERLDTSVMLARAHVAFPDETTNSTLAVAKASFDLGAFSVGAGYRYGEIENISTNRGWLVTGGYVHEDLRFGLEVEGRKTTLEPTEFTEDLGGGLGVASGVSHCSVDGLGYQGRIDWDRPAWSAFVSLRVYDYDDYRCMLDLVIPPAGGGNENGPPPHARGRALGRRLARASAANAIDATSRLVPREAALLDSSAALGFTMPVTSQWVGGAELYRDADRLEGGDTFTGLVFAGRHLTERWSLELSLGYNLADTIDDTAFAGVRVTAAL